MKQLVIDLETTGLDPVRHDIWEVGVIELGPGRERTEHLWLLKPGLAAAEPSALQVSRFYERTADVQPQAMPGYVYDIALGGDRRWSDPAALAGILARLLANAAWHGSNPAFDAGFIAPFLRLHGHAPAWNYRLCDVRPMARGYVLGLAQGRAWELGAVPAATASLSDLAALIGVDVRRHEAHTALGDCRLAADVLDVIDDITGGAG